MQANGKSENDASSISELAVPVIFVAGLFALVALLSQF